MANQALTPSEIEALKKGKTSEEQDSDRPVKVSEGREARESNSPAEKAALLAGKGVFADYGHSGHAEGRLSTSTFSGNFPAEEESADIALTNKAIESDLRKGIFIADSIFYVSASSREVCMRSMEKQGIKISKTDLTSVAGVRGARTRFNVYDNRHPKHYASGSHKTDGGGPRIQGPSGGPGSCKFVIIQR